MVFEKAQGHDGSLEMGVCERILGQGDAMVFGALCVFWNFVEFG